MHTCTVRLQIYLAISPQWGGSTGEGKQNEKNKNKKRLGFSM